MKTFAAFFLFSAVLSASLTTRGAESIEATNGIVISAELIGQLANEARTNNPGLRAAGSRVKAAALNAEAVRTWENPMAMVGGSIYGSQGFKPSEDGDLAYGIEQKLPLWGLPKLTRQIANTETTKREAEKDFHFQRLRRDITQALLTAALDEQVVNFGEQDLIWLDATAKTVENKYRSGQSVLADTLQIQNELAERNDTLTTDRHRLSHERLNLNRLLNREVNSPWPSLRLPQAAPAIPFSEKLLALALTNEPQLKVMAQEIKQAEAQATLTRRTRLPDVSLGVEGRQYSGDGEFRSGMFTLRFSLPWWNRDKYEKDFARDKAMQKSAEQERDEQVLMVKEAIHHLTVEVEAARRQALLYGDEIAVRADQALSNRLTDWANGHGTLRDVIDARRMLLDSRLTAARAVTEEHQMLAELLLWSGLNDLSALTPLADEPAILHNH